MQNEHDSALVCQSGPPIGRTRPVASSDLWPVENRQRRLCAAFWNLVTPAARESHHRGFVSLIHMIGD